METACRNRSARRGSRFRFLRRLRFQYGLRSLLLLTVAVCLVLGWNTERVRRQQRAVAALTESGAEVVYYDSSLPNDNVDDVWNFESPPTVGERLERSIPGRLREALGIDFFRRVDDVRGDGTDFNHCGDLPGVRILWLGVVLDEDFAEVGALPNLKRLHITDALCGDVALVRIGEFRNLKCLEIRNRGSRLRRLSLHCARLPKPITDAGLAYLGNLTHLKYLGLEDSAVTCAGLKHLARMSDLESLNLSGTKVTDKGSKYLADLRRLTSLYLSDTAVGDAGMESLAKLTQLECLTLERTLITDRGLASLAALGRLRFLDLTGTAVTGEGLRVLADLTSLDSLYIDDTPATRDAAAWLNRRLPELTVNFEHTPDEAPNRADALMRAGLWSEAIAALEQLGATYLESIVGLVDLGRCHAELGHHGEAARLYCAALDQIPSTPEPPQMGALFPHWVQWRWFELFEMPLTFERVAALREHDAERWLASARRAAVEGSWSRAADHYRRAVCCSPASPDAPDLTIWFECGAAQLLARRMTEYRRLREQLFEQDRRAVQAEPRDSVPDMFLGLYRGSWYAGTRLAFSAPQGEIDAAQIARWRCDVAASMWKSWDMLPLVYYREGEFAEVLRQEKPLISNDEPHYVEGRYWFARAMAHRQLGHLAEARESYLRGVQWLDRSRKIAAIRGDYDAAIDFLEAEVLRREAWRLIMDERNEAWSAETGSKQRSLREK
ncbi:MAG TPA: hypothetical protein VF278_12095 [Pirellulales bacterium]